MESARFSGILACGTLFIATSLWAAGTPVVSPVPGYVRQATWPETMIATRAAVAPLVGRTQVPVWTAVERDFPVPCDWFVQDLQALGLRLVLNDPQFQHYPAKWFAGQADADLEQKLIARALQELGDGGQRWQADCDRLQRAGSSASAAARLDLYARICQQRREVRLRTMATRCRSFVFSKHYNMGGSHYAYTEGQSDAQAERHFVPGTALCLLEMDGTTPRVRTLVEDDGGVIRDPDVS